MGTTPTYSWPYPESTDPVANGAQDIEDLALAVESTVSGLPAGKILQVVSTIKTDTFVSSSIATGAQTPITGLSASLTCASATNKVLIQVVLGMMASTAQAASAGLIIQAGGSNILVGDAASNRTQVNAAHLIYPGFGGGSVHAQLVWTGLYSPASTSAITYSVDIENNDGSSRVMYVNRNESDTDNAYTSRASSTITLMEVEA